MKLLISHVDGLVRFDFLPSATAVTSLLIADADETVLWEITAASFAPVSVEGSYFVGVRVPTTLQGLVTRRESSGEASYPRLDHVLYGEVPSGYREDVTAAKLTPGQKYCVVVFGTGLDSASEFFTA